MSTALDYVRYSCGIAGEEVAEMVDTLEVMCDRHADELKAAFEAGKKEGWGACETCHGIVGGVHQQRAAAQAHIARLREAIDRQPYTMDREVCEALAATPAQSLARIRNQVRDECAMLADDLVLYTGGDCAEAIRAMKEPE